MLNPLLTLQMLVCFIATGVCPSHQDKLGSTYPPAPRNLAWETGPPLDAPDPAAPPKPAQWPPYSWQPSPSMTSPVTWPVSPLQNHTADAVSLGHDTASHTMLNPLLTLQMLVCFIATSVCPSLQDKLGSTYPPAPRNLAWETGPPLDTPDPAAPPKPAQWPPLQLATKPIGDITDLRQDMVMINPTNNTVTLSAESYDRLAKYLAIKSLMVNGQEHEVTSNSVPTSKKCKGIMYIYRMCLGEVTYKIYSTYAW
ncbi:hypothetical protein MRX96_010987 [Rhipicephalus microplus]